MYYVFACSCGNASIYKPRKRNFTQTKCKFCGKTKLTQKRVPIYSGDDWIEAIFARRIWQEEKRKAER